MAKLHETSAWAVDETVHALHQQGLDLSVDQNDYATAHDIFGHAIGRLQQLGTADAELQLARVIRDDGFTFGREAIGQTTNETTPLFAVAQTRISQSLQMTTKL